VRRLAPRLLLLALPLAPALSRSLVQAPVPAPTVALVR
jgi:hypothetical protein